MLLAAGFAPVFSDLELSDPAMSAVQDVIALVLDGNDPNPTTVIDTRWNLVDANAAAYWLTTGVDPSLLTPPVNIARLGLHPDGLAPRTANFTEFAGQLLRHMHEVLRATHDPELAELIDECSSYAPGAERHIPATPDVVLPLVLTVGDDTLSFVSTVTSFGTSRDVNLSELSIETLYPADDETRAVLAARPWAT